jgi:hypothetical protein
MTNRIENLMIRDARLDPAEAEILISVCPERVFSTTQVRGRLTGPHCPYANTVQVAYYLREVSREYETTGDPRISHRVVIPEPNLWEPQTPFLYQGEVELWQGGQRCDQAPVVRGLRTLRLGREGLLVNGHPLAIRGLACEGCSEQEARRLHDAGYNTIVVPIGEGASRIGEIGDRYGLLIMGRLISKDQLTQARAMARHSSFLGWILDPAFFEHPLLGQAPDLLAAVLPWYPDTDEKLVGIELKQCSALAALPPGISFVACREELLPALDDVALPKLVLDCAQKTVPSEAKPGILGRVSQRPTSPDTVR